MTRCYGGKPHSWRDRIKPDAGPWAGRWIKQCDRCGAIGGAS